MMHVIDCIQGSPEWHKARSGIITASMFSIARKRIGLLTEQQTAYVSVIRSGRTEKEAVEAAGYKAKPRSEAIEKAIAGEPVGDFSDEAKNYAFLVAVERISGQALDEGFQTWQMRRGHEMEPKARMEHEIQSGLLVEPAGFVITDDKAFGCSADGFIGNKGGSEYKCFISPEKLRAFHINNDPSSVMDQVQGCMWITGREWWHIGLYCPALESVGKQLWWKSFDRDDNYIEAMEHDLWQFKLLVDEYEQRLRSKAV